MKAVLALFFLLISVVSFASNPDEILQTPSAFEQDAREAAEIPAPQGLAQDSNEDHLIEAGEERYRGPEGDRQQSAVDRAADRLDEQKHEMLDREERVAKPSVPAHAEPPRKLQPPQHPQHPDYMPPITAE